MTETQYLLICLAEEASELAQAATKALRFGLDEGRDLESGTNATCIQQEYNDLVTVIRLLESKHPEIRGVADIAHQNMKMAKIAKYRDYSKSLGIIE